MSLKTPAIHKKIRSYFQGKNVLITGGASFIGSHLAELLVKSGANVTIYDDLSSGKLENLDKIARKIRFCKGDLRRKALALTAAKNNEFLFHLAAAHGGRGYIESHPVECMNNMVLDHQVFSAAARMGVKKIVYASSACVYPITLQSTAKILLKESDANFTERGKAFSDGEYGWAKLMGELQLRAFHKENKISAIACRIFTAYGERLNESHAVVALFAKALAKKDPYPIWGNGLQTRNFTYVRDTVTGLALAGASLDGFQTINIGTSAHTTILELLEIIFKTCRWRPRVIKKELDKPVGVLCRASNNAQSLRLLGWEPEFNLEQGIRKTLIWYKTTTTSERLKSLDRLLMERN